ncbi:MAG TPA: OmpA family protein [Chitinophagales bacterium]|nr:OmpA family protein [Chitinophagales bacterium]
MAFQQKSYALAASLFKTEFNEENDAKQKAYKAFMAGESYRFSNNTQEAEKWYAEALSLNYEQPVVKLNYGLMLMANEKYNQAITQFNEYSRDDPFNKQKALELIKACKEASKWQSARTSMVLTNLSYLNTDANEYAPVFFKNKDLVFTSDKFDALGGETYNWTGEKFSDIFISKREANGEYRTNVSFSPQINSGFNDGTPAFNENFDILYFTRCGSQGKKDDFCKIYESTFDGVYWSNPVPVSLFGDTVNTGTPWLSKDATTMLFAADVPASGYGGKDLYITYYEEDHWTQPQNLGNEINTAGDEMFPYVDDEGTLYFSSSGHPGMGGLDIFSAHKSGKIWKNVVNLKPPINSGADDFGILFEKIKPRDENDPVRSSGYFSSSREGGRGGDDLYHFMLANENIFRLDGIVLEKIFENPADPNSKVIDLVPLPATMLTLKKYEGGLKLIDTVLADKFGKFTFDLEPNSHYKLNSEKQGFFNKAQDVTTKGLRDLENILITIKVRVLMERIYEEKEIVLQNIYYDYDSTVLRDDSKPVLDTLVALLNENPDVIVEIGSHTDSRGSDEYNMVLSQGRAESVVRYLIEKGIDAKRVRAKGYGETRLVNHCGNDVECTEEEHQHNRRTTFKVLSEKLVIESVPPGSIKVDDKLKKMEE